MNQTRAARASALRITEIFHSIQGESSLVGWPSVFVRLTGCPLRCGYCDTAYAFHGGRVHEQDEVLAQVASYECRHVCVTGGEPLAQAACLPLLSALADAGHVVSLETSGALSVAAVDPRVIKVVDVKTPASGEADRQLWDNLQYLSGQDQLKFVVCSREDFEWAAAQIRQRELTERCEVFVSPSHGQVNAEDLAQWVLDSRLPVRMQMQMHKQIWGERPGH